MKDRLLKSILSGSAEERDAAAREICQSRMVNMIDDLKSLLSNSDPIVREHVLLILGVIGDIKLKSEIARIGKTDSNTNVRITAIVTQEYLGKTTYDKLKAEVKRYLGKMHQDDNEAALEDSPVPDEIKPDSVERKPVVKRIDSLDDREENEKYQEKMGFPFSGRYILMFVAAAVFIAGIFLLSGDKSELKIESVQGNLLVAEMIKNRIEQINKFKIISMDPDNPASRYPMTLEIRSMEGDTYGSLFEKVYLNILPFEMGMNTIGAFWRHINFGSDTKKNDTGLWDQETSGELLLFPNPAAMNLELNSESGSLSFLYLNYNDPDLEIRIEVNSVIIR